MKALDELEAGNYDESVGNNNLTAKVIEDNVKIVDCIVDQSELKDDDADNDEVNDVLEKLHDINKKYVPYRDANPNGVNEEVEEDTDTDDNCTVASTIMDPHMVRAKMRKSILGRLKKERRRIKNKGESSVITSRDRDIRENIQSYFE